MNHIKPSPNLSKYIRLYRIVDFHFKDAAVLPFKAYSPRPEHCLQFYPRDCEEVRYPLSGSPISGKRTALIGQHTTVNHRFIGKEFLTFQVIFQPGALVQLAGIAPAEITNVYMDAEQVFGKDLALVNEQLFHAGSYGEMISIVECFLAGVVAKCKMREHRVDAVCSLMLLQDDRFSLDQYIKAACLSHRQFDRMFMERVGIPPKQWLQVIRFDKAFRMKNRYPGKDWLSIAIHCGYHDYQHLSKEYKAFTGHSPAAFFRIENGAPERSFGDVEV